MGWKSGLYILGVGAMNFRLLILFLVRLNNSLKSTVGLAVFHSTFSEYIKLEFRFFDFSIFRSKGTFVYICIPSGRDFPVWENP
jgi:hypothetical protein